MYTSESPLFTELACHYSHDDPYQMRLGSNKEGIGPARVVKVMHGGCHIAGQDFQDGEGRGNVTTSTGTARIPLANYTVAMETQKYHG